METVNKVILKGGISGLRKIGVEGYQSARFVLMTRYCIEGWNGRRLEETELHNVVVWNSCGAELFDKLNDGKIVEVEGRLRHIKYVSEEGVENTFTEVVGMKLVSVENQE